MNIKKRVAIVAAVLAVGTIAAYADVAGTDSSTTGTTADPLAGVYSNVVTFKNESTGESSTVNFLTNKTIIVAATVNGRAERIGGLWMLQDDNTTVCLAPSPLGGIPIPGPACFPLAGHVAGDQWTALNAANQTIDLAITSGQ